MSQGFLIFAFNNEKLDYLKQAVWIAGRIDKYLGKPTTIVTDAASLGNQNFNHNIIIVIPEQLSTRNFNPQEEDRSATWFNASRYQAYNITPYEETIVIDSDYIVSSNQLNLLFESPHDFICHRNVYDVTAQKSFDSLQTFGDTKMPHYWATVIFFRKSEQTKDIFEYIEMIKENYAHYSKLYKFNKTLFRNDYAVSIALMMAYGHRINAVPTIPWLLPTVGADINVTQLESDSFELHYEKYSRGSRRPMRSIISRQDFHCLNKFAMEDMINAS
jgi:hypothetical protein